MGQGSRYPNPIPVVTSGVDPEILLSAFKSKWERGEGVYLINLTECSTKPPQPPLDQLLNVLIIKAGP